MSRDNCSVVPERLELLTPSPASLSVVSGHSHAYPSEDTIVEFSQIPCTNDEIQSTGDSSHNDSLRVQPQVYGWNQREFLVPGTDEITAALIPQKDVVAPSPIALTQSCPRVVWLLPTVSSARVTYDVVLDLSLNSREIHNMEWIRFCHRDSYGEDHYEIIHQPELLRLSDPHTTIGYDGAELRSEKLTGRMKWKVMRRIKLWHVRGQPKNYDSGFTPTLTMDVHFLSGSPESAKGFEPVQLYSFQLHNSASEHYAQDPQFKEHLPSLWSIDVNHRASYTHPPAPKRCIAAYSFSQDGHHIVICAQHINESAALDKVIDLELWVLKDETGKNVQTSPFLRTSERLQLKSYFQPSVSVSANGSQISCLDSTTTLRCQRVSADSSAYYPVYALARRSESLTELVLHPSTKACRRFQHYRGEGRFQCAEPGVNDHKPQSGPQYFVTYNKTSLDVYNADEGWKHLHRLDMQSVGFNPHNSDNITLSKNLRSRYFVATRDAGYGQRGLILVWDYEQGLLVSFDETPGVTSQICISDAALMMALFENEHVHLYRTRTLTLLGSVHVPQAKGAVGRLHFISKDSGILLEFVHPEGSPLIGGGFVLDIATLSIVKKISFTGTGSISPLEMLIDCFQNGIPIYHQLTSVSAIPLSASMHLKLTTVSGMCDSRCPQSSQARSPLYKEVHSDSGLHFTMTKDNNRITVVASDDSGQHKQMAISSPRIKDESGIFDSGSHFVVYLGNLCIIWALPVAITDTFELVSVRYPEDLIICRHGRPQLSTRFFAPVQQYEHHINKQHAAAPFQKEIPSLYVEQNGDLQVRLSDLLGCNLDGLDNSTRSTIFRYIRGFLKDYNGVKSAWDKIVGADTSNPLATEEAYHLLKGLSELLTSTSDCIWIPQIDMKISDNPLVKFFQASNHLPELTIIITVVMEYYLQQARIHKDPCFVQLVTQALSFIMRAEGSNHVAVSRILHEVSMRTLREAAFIPVRDHLFVFKHHVLARSLSSYFPDVFCDNEEKVMHLVVKEEKERKASTQESVDQETSDLEKTDSEGRVRGDIQEAARKDLDCIESSRFKYDVFVAPIDLLWGPYKNDGIIDDPYEKESHCSSRVAIFHSYRRAFFPLLWLKLMPNAKPYIKCHEWDHQTFDNPAIAALVEYKWNSFGFYYWLLVFCCKASLYFMILTVVFIQTDNLQVDLTWLLISTMGVAAVLLWFEIVQFLKKGLAYTLSIFNLIDCTVFLSSFLSCASQLAYSKGLPVPNIFLGVLSFTAVAVVVHVVFEFRVFGFIHRSTAILPHAYNSMLPYIAAYCCMLIGATIGLRHMLHACLDADCNNLPKDSPTKFPLHFSNAITSTFFITAGRYDEVENEFQSERLAFHISIFTFYVGAVFFLTNIFIAMVNQCFEESERTWKLDLIQHRLRYAEKAENISYAIPGFRRRNREWFQDSIYYTATPKTVREYNAKTLRLRDEVVIESSPAFDMHRFPAGISDRDPSVEEGGRGGGVCGSHDIETRKEIEALRNQVNSQQQVMNDFSAAFHKNTVEVSKQMEEMMGLLKKLSERNG
ncbi:hypothetical protein BKA57DRAFT_451723 [Linnemannia elongata]|nr:hypothetical protein BKA57DRAFT_451723 [Linnemannia elongata]